MKQGNEAIQNGAESSTNNNETTPKYKKYSNNDGNKTNDKLNRIIVTIIQIMKKIKYK